MKGRGLRPRAGFTLAELLVVLAVLGVVLALGAPAAPAAGDDDPSRAVRARCLAARRLAVERGVPVTLTAADLGHRAARRPPEVPDDALPVGLAPPQGGGEGEALVFDPEGYARGELLLPTEGAGVARVVVDPWSGRCHVSLR